jgi:ABC-type transport system involved in multi-copper enzyme maturation permease subunit
MSSSLVLVGASASTFAIWLTPIWLLCVGVTLALVVLGVIYGVLLLAVPRLAAVIKSMVTEGIFLPLAYFSLVLVGFALLGTMLVPYRGLMSSVTRLSAPAPEDVVITIPPATKKFEVPVHFRHNELQALDIESDQPVTVDTKMQKLGLLGSIRVEGGKVVRWVRQSHMEQPYKDPVEHWNADNLGKVPAKLRVHAETDVEFPEVRVVPRTMIAVLGFVAIFLAIRLLLPKVAAIALTTSKESMGQPLFPVVMGLGAFALFAFIYIPYNTFGEDIKILKDSGLTLIMVLAILVAVWSASVSVADEIEGRTALTVLSKPIRRWQFIIGKFLGVISPIVLMFVTLGFLFLVVVSYKAVYDSHESAHPEPPWQTCYLEIISTLPGLVLGLMETVVLAAISVAISTRLPMLANLVVCFSIYVLGHITPMLVASSVGQFEIVRFVGQFIATVLPVLDHFNIQAAVAAGADVPHSYLLWALGYCALYCTVAMLLALAMFEDRDLA